MKYCCKYSLVEPPIDKRLPQLCASPWRGQDEPQIQGLSVAPAVWVVKVHGLLFSLHAVITRLAALPCDLRLALIMPTLVLDIFTGLSCVLWYGVPSRIW
jgi:hypothetical protein